MKKVPQPVVDVLTGKAALEGAKVVGKGLLKGLKGAVKGTLGNALNVEKRHKKVTDSGYFTNPIKGTKYTQE